MTTIYRSKTHKYRILELTLNDGGKLYKIQSRPLSIFPLFYWFTYKTRYDQMSDVEEAINERILDDNSVFNSQIKSEKIL